MFLMAKTFFRTFDLRVSTRFLSERESSIVQPNSLNSLALSTSTFSRTILSILSVFILFL